MNSNDNGKLEKSWLNLVKTTVLSWWNDDVPRLGASLAYYMIFSLAPSLVFALSIAGLVYGTDAVEGRLARELEDVMGTQAAGAVQSLLATTQQSGQGPMASLLKLSRASFSGRLFGIFSPR